MPNEYDRRRHDCPPCRCDCDRRHDRRDDRRGDRHDDRRDRHDRNDNWPWR